MKPPCEYVKYDGLIEKFVSRQRCRLSFACKLFNFHSKYFNTNLGVTSEHFGPAVDNFKLLFIGRYEALYKRECRVGDKSSYLLRFNVGVSKTK